MLIFYREVLLNHSSQEPGFVNVRVQNNVLNCNVQALQICGVDTAKYTTAWINVVQCVIYLTQQGGRV